MTLKLFQNTMVKLDFSLHQAASSIVPIFKSSSLLFLDSKRVGKLFFNALDTTISSIVNRNTQKDLQIHIKAGTKDHIRRLFILLQLMRVQNFISERYPFLSELD